MLLQAFCSLWFKRETNRKTSIFWVALLVVTLLKQVRVCVFVCLCVCVCVCVFGEERFFEARGGGVLKALNLLVLSRE